MLAVACPCLRKHRRRFATQGICDVLVSFRNPAGAEVEDWWVRR